MIRQKSIVILRKSMAAAVFCCLISVSYAVPQYEIDFVKGNVSQKIEALKKSSDNNDSSLILKAIQFAFSSQESIGNDSEINALMAYAVKLLDLDTIPSEKRNEVIAELGNIYKSFPDSVIQTAVLEKMEMYPSSTNVSLVNAYLSEKIQKSVSNPSESYMDSVTKACVKLLKNQGNKTSFNLLFMADFMGLWQDNKSFLEEAFGPLANDSGNEILSMFSSAKPAEKLKILQILSGNDIISIKIKGEVAEKALSDVINIMGSNPKIVPTKEETSIQMLAVKLISETKWTKAARKATAFFSIARKEYEDGYINSENFSNLITDIAAVACSSTGQVLSTYLDYLNKSMERNDAPSETVLLSVINALGGLGDKTAFDYLLYVTYLNYPQYITNAARNALAQLKW